MKNFILYTIIILNYVPYLYADNNIKFYGYTNSTAQGVADIQASRGSISHHGGNKGYEGVGFSSRSAEEAIRNCCYWGKKIPLEIGVSRGLNGWYACVRYK